MFRLKDAARFSQWRAHGGNLRDRPEGESLSSKREAEDDSGARNFIKFPVKSLPSSVLLKEDS